MIREALKWARENPEEVRKMCGEGGGEWKGLVCVHAQEEAVRTWERNGFVIDKEMGEWVETEKRHFGLWQRVELGGVSGVEHVIESVLGGLGTLASLRKGAF